MKILYCITLLYLFTVFHNFITSSAFWLEKGHQHCLIWILADIQWHLGLLKCMLRSCWVVIGWFWSESEHAHFRQNHVFLFAVPCDRLSSFSCFTFCLWSPGFGLLLQTQSTTILFKYSTRYRSWKSQHINLYYFNLKFVLYAC